MATWQDSPTRVDGNGDPGLAAEEVTRPDEIWPIPREYRVDPTSSERTLGHGGHFRPPAAGRARAAPRRRLPVSRDSLAGLVLLVALALGAGAWYVLHGHGTSSATVRPGKVTFATQNTGKPRYAKAVHPARLDAPALVGRRLEAVRTALERLGLRVTVATMPSPKPAGTVLRQTPPAGASVSRGAAVVLVVSSGPRPVGVPNVVGAEVAYAARRIRDEGLRVRIDRVRSSEAAGTVLAESPDAGSRVPRGTVVHLSVAKPAPAREPRVAVLAVPRVVGLRVADAEARLDARGLSWRVTQQDSDRPKGEVVSQTPDSGARVRKGARVTLGVSSGPAPVPVPDVTGLDEASARSELDDAGFSVSVVDQPTTDPTQDGLVADESPAGGSQAKRGAPVTITVARYG